MQERKIDHTKKFRYEKMNGRKKCTDEKINYEKMPDEKTRDEKLRDEKLRTKKCPTKICRTKIGPDTFVIYAHNAFGERRKVGSSPKNGR